MNYSNLWVVLRKSFSAWMDDEAPQLGAALAFYTILSLAPLLILIVGIAATFFGDSKAQGQIIGQVSGLIGQEGADAIRVVIEHAAQKSASGTLASIVGVITLVFGASRVLDELRSSLNKMWDVKRDAPGGIWGMIKRRFFSFGLVLAVGFLLILSLVLSTALAIIGKFFAGILPLPEFVLSAINFAVSLAGIAFLFALIFKYVPERKIGWKDVWFGAIATAFFFTIGKHLVALYVGKAAVGSLYGAAASVVVLVVWVYYSAMIFLFGAKFTHVLERARTELAEPRRFGSAPVGIIGSRSSTLFHR
jgi:membrane protein